MNSLRSNDDPTLLFVCAALNIGGAERQWSLMIPELAKHGYSVSLLTLVSEGPYFEVIKGNGVRATCARMRNRADVRGAVRALASAEEGPDLVVTHSVNAHVIGHLIARRAQAAHLATIHTAPQLQVRRHRRALTRLVAPRVDWAVAVSTAQIPEMIAMGFRHEAISVIPNAVPPLDRSMSRQTVRRELGLDDGAFVAAIVATLRPEKRVEVFIRAVQRAHASDHRVFGLVAGDGPEFDRLRALADSSDAVRMLGERTDASDILGAADVACLSSETEGLPMALLEAMSLGLPIVATNVPGITDAVEHGRSALLVPPGDDQAFARALVRLAVEPTLAAELGAAARSRQLEVFSFDRMIADYASTIDGVLRRNRSTSASAEGAA